MLWLMRRPWMKALQRLALDVVPPPLQARARRSHLRQNRFARRYGVTLLTGTIYLFLASLCFTLTYQLALTALESGVLTPPDRLLSAMGN
jgi:hypothetical protein